MAGYMCSAAEREHSHPTHAAIRRRTTEAHAAAEGLVTRAQQALGHTRTLPHKQAALRQSRRASQERRKEQPRHDTPVAPIPSVPPPPRTKKLPS